MVEHNPGTSRLDFGDIPDPDPEILGKNFHHCGSGNGKGSG